MTIVNISFYFLQQLFSLQVWEKLYSKTIKFYLDSQTEMMERKLFDLEKLTKLRRYIHQNPELAFEEVGTSEAIIRYLKKLGIQDSQIRRVAKTGIIVDIHGKAPPVTHLFP